MARLTRAARARRYLQASMEAGYAGLPAEHREAKHELMRAHERAYPRVREHALVGSRKHFDEPLTAGEREHQTHLRREAGIENRDAERIRRELDEASGTLRERAREAPARAASAGAAGAGGALSSALGGGGNTILYAIGLGLLLLLLYQLVAGKAGELIASLVGVGAGSVRAFIAPIDPLASLEGALGAAPIAAGSSSSRAPASSASEPPPAVGPAGYVAPLVGATRGRVDQGVDFSAPAGSAVRALGAGTITKIYPFYRGQPAIVERLSSGPLRGRSIYYAEQLTPGVRVGERVGAGQTIARVASSGTGLELGFASPGGTPLAQATGGYVEGQQTHAGLSFSRLLQELGI